MNSFSTDSSVCTLTVFRCELMHLRTSGRKFLLKNKDYDDRPLSDTTRSATTFSPAHC